MICCLLRIGGCHGIVLWGSDLSLVIKFIYWVRYGPVAQLVRAPPCHGGGRRFESVPGRDGLKITSYEVIFFINGL